MNGFKLSLNWMFFFTNEIFVIFLTALLSAGCANVGMITGGEKDTTPPKIVKEIPENFKTNFNSKNILIQFDEYLATTNLRSEITITPEPESAPLYAIRGKNLIIKFDGDLQPNTTYTISFGRGIADLNENNVLLNYSYVFSTGNFIDSNSITGYVKDIISLKPSVGFLVGLLPYSEEKSDSIVFSRPRYYTVTDSNGFFQINYLPVDSFFILTFDDKNKNFKLQMDVDNAGFYPLKISSDSTPVVIYSAPQVRKPKNLFAKLTSDYSLYLTYQVPINKLVVNDLLNTQDVLFFWNKYVDTVELFFNNPIRDSVMIEIKSEHGIDTIRLKKRESLNGKVELKQLSRSQISILDSIGLISNFPINRIDTSKVSVFLIDSLKIPLKHLNFEGRNILLDFDKKSNASYKVMILPEAVFYNSSVYNKDTIVFEYKVLNTEDFGVLRLTISLDTLPKGVILVLASGKREIFRKIIEKKTLNFELKNLLPGNYHLQLFVDKNEDGLWNGGDVFTRQLPEPIVLYPQEITLRANWELDIDWNIPLRDAMLRFTPPQ